MKVRRPKKESRIGLLLLSKYNEENLCVIVVTRGLLSLDGIIVAEGSDNEIITKILSEKMFKQVSFIVPLTQDSERIAYLLTSKANVSLISESDLVDNHIKKLLYEGYVKLTFKFTEKLISLRKNMCKTN